MNPLLQEARAAAEAGDKAEAHRQIARVLQANPKDAAAWFLLSTLVDSPQQQATFLRKTLALAPDHAEAQQQLARLEGAPPPPVPLSPEPPAPAAPLPEPPIPEPTPPLAEAGDLDWLTAEPTGEAWPAAETGEVDWLSAEPAATEQLAAAAWPATETDDLSWLTTEPTGEPVQGPAWQEAEAGDLSWLTGESSEATWTTAEQPAEMAWPEVDTSTWPPPQAEEATSDTGESAAFAEAAASDELPDWLAQAEPELARQMPDLATLEEEETTNLAGELDEEPLPDWLRQEVALDWLEEPAAPVEAAPAAAAVAARPRRRVDRTNVLLVVLIVLAVIVLLALWYFIFVTFF